MLFPALLILFSCCFQMLFRHRSSVEILEEFFFLITSVCLLDRLFLFFFGLVLHDVYDLNRTSFLLIWGVRRKSDSLVIRITNLKVVSAVFRFSSALMWLSWDRYIEKYYLSVFSSIIISWWQRKRLAFTGKLKLEKLCNCKLDDNNRNDLVAICTREIKACLFDLCHFYSNMDVSLKSMLSMFVLNKRI